MLEIRTSSSSTTSTAAAAAKAAAEAVDLKPSLQGLVDGGDGIFGRVDEGSSVVTPAATGDTAKGKAVATEIGTDEAEGGFRADLVQGPPALPLSSMPEADAVGYEGTQSGVRDVGTVGEPDSVLSSPLSTESEIALESPVVGEGITEVDPVVPAGTDGTPYVGVENGSADTGGGLPSAAAPAAGVGADVANDDNAAFDGPAFVEVAVAARSSTSETEGPPLPSSSLPEAHTDLLPGVASSSMENPAQDNLFRVFLVFQEMRSRGVKPDLRAYNALVNTCADLGEFDRALGVVRQMVDEDHGGGLQPDSVTYTSLIKAAARAHPPRVDEAEEVRSDRVFQCCC